MTCPRCGSQKAYNNGLTPCGSQRYKCAVCRKTWTPDPKVGGKPSIFGYPMSNAERQRRHREKKEPEQ